MSKLQEELETMKPMLEEAVQESIQTMAKIEKDTAVAEETKIVVLKEEEGATAKAKETQTIAGIVFVKFNFARSANSVKITSPL